MSSAKIDYKLLRQIEILSSEKPLPCFVCCKNFSQTKNLLSKSGIHILNEYLFINTLFCKASKKQILAMSNFAAVDYIFSIATASAMMFVSKKILGCEGTDLSGKGVGVAFIDTGISPHFDFLIGKSRLSFFKDFVGGRTEPYDDNGHGTFVSGVCSGSGVMSNFRYCGVAPKSQIFALKALNENGEASANKILDAMEWIFDNHKKLGIKVACMSFGSEPLGANDPIMLGADALWNDGVVVVAAAGNSGPEYQTIKSPGTSGKIITVGGIDDNRYDNFSYNKKYFEIADFSSRGPAFRNIKPDVVAPSVDIVSCSVSNGYRVLSGTSVAAPMVAGLCCLLLEKYPELAPKQIKSMLIRACQPLGFDKNLEGFGVPNLARILR